MEPEPASKREKAEAAMPVLHYFAGRGMANPLRFVLALAGITWQENALRERQQMLDLIASGHLAPFEQVPMLEIDGKYLTQSFATIKYIAATRSLYGKENPSVDDVYHVDTLADGARDFYVKFVPLPFNPTPETYIEEVLKKKVITKYLPIFNNLLKASKFLAGNQPTYADAVLLTAVEFALDVFGADVLDDYPHLAKWKEAAWALPGMAMFKGSANHFGMPDKQYALEVDTALGRR
ncbi:hypothetical protein PTSG_08179 [Salpingoeca rosetta]|uniref:Glutathione transferase n=1 Tax=Salpingoeca rosetta (strain ATCC 50818 / BSB-021) TaxID=946362 RepID=F2UI83_SALR5|nr:uncharacterized protein PTSG_08179 [Salpingoeca rosetta]EGD76832.1 hypothetical protein PTSG_08179 [Salpingoeca rosetta]|eukprot:XP_004991204.1 hypothetical protein PTSG_08179 [Salpingoeca rosetta]